MYKNKVLDGTVFTSSKEIHNVQHIVSFVAFGLIRPVFEVNKCFVFIKLFAAFFSP